MRYSIVVVDDDPASREQVKELLSEEKMDVTCLDSGDGLLEYVEKNNPDLILMDTSMPDTDGFDTYIALRRFEDHTERTHVPVIFTTEGLDTETEEYGFVIGASDYITKPFDKYVLMGRIINAIKNSRKIENLREEATIDKLTGFLNKAKGTERVSKLCKRKKGALIILDLDSFKLVNDLYGHETGDMILKAFADVARKNVRETDTICRIGGDEFMGFLDDLTDETVLRSLSFRFNSNLTAEAQKIMGEDHGIPLGISMGAVMVPEMGRDYDALFEMADSALYKVKQNGKHGYLVYGKERIVDKQSEEGLLKKLERTIQTLEERNESNGTMVLGRDAFAVAYRFVMRYYRRYGGPATLMLFQLSLTKEEDELYLSEALEQFNSILQKMLRKSDIVMQSDAQSFLVMLTECVESEVENVIKRITDAFEEAEHREAVTVSYVYKYMVKAEAVR